MTVDEYMDPKRFPRTTQVPPISVENQLTIDHVNYQDVQADREMGKPIDPAHAATVAELDAKRAVRDQVMADAKAAGRL